MPFPLIAANTFNLEGMTMTLIWKKAPSVMTGGKRFFEITRNADNRKLCVVWSCWERKYLAQVDDKTVFQSESVRECKRYLESL